MVTIEQVRQDPEVAAFIDRANESLKALGYTEHGPRHAGRVGKEAARMLAADGVIGGDGGLGGGAEADRRAVDAHLGWPGRRRQEGVQPVGQVGSGARHRCQVSNLGSVVLESTLVKCVPTL